MSTSVLEIPYQDAQWKQKYRSVVREFDTLDSDWRETKSKLHKLILRLSSTYIG